MQTYAGLASGGFALRIGYAVASLIPIAAGLSILSADINPLHPANALTLSLLATPVLAAAISLLRHGRSSSWNASLTLCSLWWAAAALFLYGRLETTSDILGPLLVLVLPVWSLVIRLRKS